MASLDPADRPIAEQLRDMLGSRLARLVTRKNERDGVEAFYRARNFAPLWIEAGAEAKRTAAAKKYLGGVDADGLEPDEYRAPDFGATAPDALAEADLRFTATVLNFIRHAQNGRVHFTRVSGDIFYPPRETDMAAALTSLAEAKDVAAALDAFQPQHPGYKALKAKLADEGRRRRHQHQV
jgi:murein L,D-transpeptidase YcbB/YkuD